MKTLYMIQLGARPKNRLIEQHDMFFGIADTLNELIPAINHHWPEVQNKWHIDSYRAVTTVINQDGAAYSIEWQDDLSDANTIDTTENANNSDDLKLFFINLGGYQQGSDEEFHYKMLVVSHTQTEAVKEARRTDFYKTYSYNDKDTPFKGVSHVDDKHEVDVDDIYQVDRLLSSGKLVIKPIEKSDKITEDKSYVGYLSLKTLKQLGL